MFTNFDGAGGLFGDVGVAATTSDVTQVTAYASDEDLGARQAVVVINNATVARTVGVCIAAPRALATAARWLLDGSSAELVATSAVTAAVGLAIVVPERSAARRPALPWLASIAFLLVIATAAYAHRRRAIEIEPVVDAVVEHDTICRWESLMVIDGLPRRDVCGLTMMAWARANLPATALVVTPPYFVHPVAGFRFRAQRRVLVTFKDGGEATFDDGFAAAWIERLHAIAGPVEPGPSQDLDGFWMETLYPAIQAYDAARQVRFDRLQARYGVTHAVCQINGCAHLTWPIIYADRAFTIRAAPVQPSMLDAPTGFATP